MVGGGHGALLLHSRKFLEQRPLQSVKFNFDEFEVAKKAAAAAASSGAAPAAAAKAGRHRSPDPDSAVRIGANRFTSGRQLRLRLAHPGTRYSQLPVLVQQ